MFNSEYAEMIDCFEIVNIRVNCELENYINFYKHYKL